MQILKKNLMTSERKYYKDFTEFFFVRHNKN